MPRTIDQRVLQAASVVLLLLLVAGLAVAAGVVAPVPARPARRRQLT